jgi:hypothetical protein
MAYMSLTKLTSLIYLHCQKKVAQPFPNTALFHARLEMSAGNVC